MHPLLHPFAARHIGASRAKTWIGAIAALAMTGWLLPSSAGLAQEGPSLPTTTASNPTAEAPAGPAAGPGAPMTASPGTVPSGEISSPPSSPGAPGPAVTAPAGSGSETAGSPSPAPATDAPSPTGISNPSAASGSAVNIGPLPDELSPWGMFLHADIVVKVVMIGLALASVVTWTVLLAKTIELRLARRRARGALHTLFQARTLSEAARTIGTGRDVVPRLIEAAQAELAESADLRHEGVKERLTWQLERIEVAAGRHVARGMSILATIGAVAPFVGLFGTVWGIMNSFVGISRAHTTNLAVVAPGIAEALLATAFGLVAAIPAVVIYNAFTRSIGGYRAVLADASVALLRLVSRDLDREAAPASVVRRLPMSETPALSVSQAAE